MLEFKPNQKWYPWVWLFFIGFCLAMSVDRGSVETRWDEFSPYILLIGFFTIPVVILSSLLEYAFVRLKIDEKGLEYQGLVWPLKIKRTSIPLNDLAAISLIRVSFWLTPTYEWVFGGRQQEIRFKERVFSEADLVKLLKNVRKHNPNVLFTDRVKDWLGEE